MVLQIKEHLPAAILDQVDDLRATLGKQLLPDFKNPNLVTQKLNPVPSIFEVIDIEGENQSILGIIHRDFLSGPGPFVRLPVHV